MEKDLKKILKIRKGEYLLEIRNNAVATTYLADSALDISNWSLEQLGYIIGNLKKVGYTKASVVTVEKGEEVKPSVTENVERNVEEDVEQVTKY